MKYVLALDIRRAVVFYACAAQLQIRTEAAFCNSLHSRLNFAAYNYNANSHAAVQACDDKMQTQLLLSGSGMPMPATMLTACFCGSPFLIIYKALPFFLPVTGVMSTFSYLEPRSILG